MNSTPPPPKKRNVKYVLHIKLEQVVQKLYFQYGGGWPSWIYAN